jgi:hypothetical protein
MRFLLELGRARLELGGNLVLSRGENRVSERIGLCSTQSAVWHKSRYGLNTKYSRMPIAIGKKNGSYRVASINPAVFVK